MEHYRGAPHQEDMQQALKELQGSIAALIREIREVCITRIMECVAMQRDLAEKLVRMDSDRDRVRSPIPQREDSCHIPRSPNLLDRAPQGALFRNCDRSASTGRLSRSSSNGRQPKAGSMHGSVLFPEDSIGEKLSSCKSSDWQFSTQPSEPPMPVDRVTLGDYGTGSAASACHRSDCSQNLVFTPVCPAEPSGVKSGAVNGDGRIEFRSDMSNPVMQCTASKPWSTEVTPFAVQEVDEELTQQQQQDLQRQQPQQQHQQFSLVNACADRRVASEEQSLPEKPVDGRHPTVLVTPEQKLGPRKDLQAKPGVGILEDEVFDYNDELDDVNPCWGVIKRPAAKTLELEHGQYIDRNVGKQQTILHEHIKPMEGPLVYRIVKHTHFDLASGLLILLNTAFVGCETDFMAKNFGNTNDTYAHLRHCFNVAFTCELAMRIMADKVNFFTSDGDFAWNYFDLVMVFSSWLELFFQTLDFGRSSSAGRVLRILRIVRITRAMRIGRILRYARTFRQIAYSLQSSIGTLFWAMVMIFLVVYCFAICFCQAVTEYRTDKGDAALAEDLYLYKELWLGVPQSLFSLYLAMTGGRNWGEVVNPLMEVGWAYTALFIVFISLTFFGVLNVVTAIFVDSALQSQQYYKDLLIQESMLRKQLYTQHLRHVFEQIDQDASGCINVDEMEYFLTDPNLNLYLQSIDIFPNDARALFKLLDRDDSGAITIEEFCEGCLRLKGEAKSFDLHCLIFNNALLQEKVDAIIELVATAKSGDASPSMSGLGFRNTIGH